MTVPRYAVVDLGSNSVRLVVFEGVHRNPRIVFNEKAVLRLGSGLEETGRLNEDGVARALTVMARYNAVARAMQAEHFEVLATAAVRDAANGPAFVANLQRVLPGVPMRILSGAEEADFSAEGVMCGIPGANGVLADQGGGSLELVRLIDGTAHGARTLPLGVIRLADRAGNDMVRARAIALTDLATVPWLGEGEGLDLFAVGGTWRALARIHMLQLGYPLNVLHHYTIRREEARDLTAMVSTAPRRTLERLPGVPRRRVDDLPVAALVLRRLLRATSAARVVFSAAGLREGWLMRQMPPAVRAADPLIAAGKEAAAELGRDTSLPPALIAWSAALYPDEPPDHRRLREAACWFADIGIHDHPEYRAAEASSRILHHPGIGFDHYSRAFLSICIGTRYDAEPGAPFLEVSRHLLDPASIARAEALGHALRLAGSLCGGMPSLLAGTSLVIDGQTLRLDLAEGGSAYAGDGMLRRLDDVARAFNLRADASFGLRHVRPGRTPAVTGA